MNKRVIDSSVLLAVAFGEVGHDPLIPVIQGAHISAVNYAEVMTKMADTRPHRNAWPLVALLDSLEAIEPFTRTQADVAAALRPSTRSAGLSLGDRACIALAMELDAEAWTADRQWLTVKLPCKVRLIR